MVKIWPIRRSCKNKNKLRAGPRARGPARAGAASSYGRPRLVARLPIGPAQVFVKGEEDTRGVSGSVSAVPNKHTRKKRGKHTNKGLGGKPIKQTDRLTDPLSKNTTYGGCKERDKSSKLNRST